jgi:hypothetical protein
MGTSNTGHRMLGPCPEVRDRRWGPAGRNRAGGQPNPAMRGALRSAAATAYNGTPLFQSEIFLSDKPEGLTMMPFTDDV